MSSSIVFALNSVEKPIEKKKYSELEKNGKYHVIVFERKIVQKTKQSIVLATVLDLQKNEKIKFFLPKEYSDKLTDELIDEVNTKKTKINLIYTPVEKIPAFTCELVQ